MSDEKEKTDAKGSWLLSLGWGFLLYLLAVVTLFFIFAQAESSFIYMAF